MILHSPVIYTRIYEQELFQGGRSEFGEDTDFFLKKRSLGREDRKNGTGEEPLVEFVSRKAAHRTSRGTGGPGRGVDEYQAGGPYG